MEAQIGALHDTGILNFKSTWIFQTWNTLLERVPSWRQSYLQLHTNTKDEWFGNIVCIVILERSEQRIVINQAKLIEICYQSLTWNLSA